MAEVNFENMQGLELRIYPAAEVPKHDWADLQVANREAVRALLPHVDWDRADEIVNWGNASEYELNRTHPPRLVRTGEWNKQLIGDIDVGVIYERGLAVGSVITQNTASPRFLADVPGLWGLEAGIKYFCPPSWRVPIVGGRKHVHFREVYIHPEIQGFAPERRVRDRPVSGAVVASLYHLLKRRHPAQAVAAYRVLAASADAEMVNITNVLDFEVTGETPERSLRGFAYPVRLQRVQRGVRDLLDTVIKLPDARQTIERLKPRRNRPA